MFTEWITPKRDTAFVVRRGFTSLGGDITGDQADRRIKSVLQEGRRSEGQEVLPVGGYDVFSTGDQKFRRFGGGESEARVSEILCVGHSMRSTDAPHAQTEAHGRP
jgi:hypothetical protein